MCNMFMVALGKGPFNILASDFPLFLCKSNNCMCAILCLCTEEIHKRDNFSEDSVSDCGSDAHLPDVTPISHVVRSRWPQSVSSISFRLKPRPWNEQEGATVEVGETSHTWSDGVVLRNDQHLKQLTSIAFRELRSSSAGSRMDVPHSLGASSPTHTNRSSSAESIVRWSAIEDTFGSCLAHRCRPPRQQCFSSSVSDPSSSCWHPCRQRHRLYLPVLFSSISWLTQ